MTERKKITKKIQTQPSILTSNLYTDIKKLIQESELGACSKQHGYILDVENTSVKSCSVSESNSYLNFEVEYSATTLKPKVGSQYTGRVCLIFAMGILVNVAEIMKVFIPTTSHANFTFNPDLNQITYKKDKSEVTLNNGDLVRISVTGVQFNESSLSFNCYGAIV
jgi:DNA-directed RNA polymerase subunit E'/Rpb7